MVRGILSDDEPPSKIPVLSNNHGCVVSFGHRLPQRSEDDPFENYP